METLRVGDRFPTLRVDTVDGSTLEIPTELHDLRAVLLFYRGRW